MRVRLLPLLFAALIFHCLTNQASPAPSALGRPTSQPYAGDLSIFEGKQRAKICKSIE